MAGHVFTRKQLDEIFGNVIDKTLGEVDTQNVFSRTITNPKITGIAGDVVEQSILKYGANSDRQADLVVDGVETELKTTGIRIPKKENDFLYEAKEPMSITAVSPPQIIHEEFDHSHFWHKLEHLLLVYYHYNSPTTVPAAAYADFVIKGYHFHEFTDEERQILKNDWLIVRNFIRMLHEKYHNPVLEYPRISSEIRKQLMLIDTAPKWPNAPRFRLKRTAVSTIVQKYFGKKLEQLEDVYTSFSAIDQKLSTLATTYKGKTVRELMDILDIPLPIDKADVGKGITEQIVIKMFGGQAKKLSKIELFSQVGLIPKTIVQTTTGQRTEDTKLFKIDFEEWTADTIFEESFLYQYVNGQQFLCIVFEEPSSDAKLLDNIFVGFKRLTIPEHLIETDIKSLWEDVRRLVLNQELKETIMYKKNGDVIRNAKTNTVRTQLNFPKSSQYTFFVRGSGIDSTQKNVVLNGIQMYAQYVWMKGAVLNKMLAEEPFI